MSVSWRDLVNSITISPGTLINRKTVSTVIIHTGIRGAPGPQGIPGPKGDTGSIGEAGSISGSSKREEIYLTDEIISEKQVTLLYSPIVPETATVTPLGGVSQDYEVDYIITNNILSWNNLGLEDILEAGDILQIEYFI